MPTKAILYCCADAHRQVDARTQTDRHMDTLAKVEASIIYCDWKRTHSSGQTALRFALAARKLRNVATAMKFDAFEKEWTATYPDVRVIRNRFALEVLNRGKASQTSGLTAHRFRRAWLRLETFQTRQRHSAHLGWSADRTAEYQANIAALVAAAR